MGALSGLGGWPWQNLGMIRSVATAIELGDILFILSGKQCMISLIFHRQNFMTFEHNTLISVTMKTFGTEF